MRRRGIEVERHATKASGQSQILCDYMVSDLKPPEPLEPPNTQPLNNAVIIGKVTQKKNCMTDFQICHSGLQK